MTWFTPSTTLATLNEGDQFDFPFSVTGYASLEFISGKLPPGIEFKNDGLIGVLGNIKNPLEEIFSFTIRAKNNDEIEDRDFSIVGLPTNRQCFWDESSLPNLRDELGFYDLGKIGIGDLFVWTFTAIDLDEDKIKFSLIKNNLSEQISIVPDDLNLREDGYFEGVIQAETLPGIYRFNINITTDFDNLINSLPFKIEIISQETTTVSDLVFIKWITEDTMKFVSGLPSNKQLKTQSSEIVEYSLAPGSNPLPNGLIIDKQNGFIKGIVFNESRTDFFVTFRASVGAFYIDKKVRILGENKINFLPNKLYLNITGLQQKEINEIKSGLLLDRLYRLSDEFFNSGDVQIELSNWITISNQEIFDLTKDLNEIRLIGGDFFVREILEDNIVIYKELVQKIIDPLKRNFDFNLENFEIVWAKLIPSADPLNDVNLLRKLRTFQGINYVFKQVAKLNAFIKPTVFDLKNNSAALSYTIENEDRLLVGQFVLEKINSVKLNGISISYQTDAERIYFSNSSGIIEIEISVDAETKFDGIPYTLYFTEFERDIKFTSKYFKLRDLR